jgi:hypothetical protein
MTAATHPTIQQIVLMDELYRKFREVSEESPHNPLFRLYSSSCDPNRREIFKKLV